MTKQLTRDEFLRNLGDSGLFSREEMAAVLGSLPETADGNAVARALLGSGKLTAFQAAAVRERNFAELVIGNYQVLDRLGAGGMGTVYKARHRRMKRVVAIKVLSRNVAQSDRFVQRFQREVEAVARLSHPNVVMAHDADEAEAGHFLVMEFVNGRDLASEVVQRGPLPISEAVACVLQAARGLDYAHRQGIIHRDIKPANLLRDTGGVVKVADLGLARFNDSLGAAAEAHSALTQAGSIMGTVDFMPPEQALGLTTIDHRADVYSLGCTLHYLVVGLPPYQGPTLMAILLQHREAPVPSLCAARAGVPSDLDSIFQRMVAKKPEDRFPSMAEVVAALEALAPVPEPSPAHPVKPTAGPPAVPTLDGGPVPGSPDAAGTAGGAGPGAGTVDLAPAENPDAATGPVLLVEPSRSQAVIIRGYLQKLGFQEVLTAASGEKALELARGTPPQTVVSAMHLPDMTGVLLAQRLRAEERLSRTGFVLITSQADAQEAHLPGDAGDPVRLAKPFGLDQLLLALSEARGRAGPRPAGSLRVLVVDDSAAARVHVRGVLRGLGVGQIVEAADGAEAVALLEKETFDLVVTDYTMPRLDGRGLIEFIRQRSRTPAVPVIVVTTETDPAKLDAVRRLGVSAISDKTFKPEVVLGVLNKLG
jgi:CheY-like chemotaxis protein/tRNA A-37 threonylcarbamoyl transferase component Bud32